MLQDAEGQWGWKGSTSAYDGALVKDIFDAIRRAIELNGVSIEDNLAAFE